MPSENKVVFRDIDYAALVAALRGPEQPIVTYRFRDRVFTQRPGQGYRWARRPEPGKNGGN